MLTKNNTKTMKRELITLIKKCLSSNSKDSILSCHQGTAAILLIIKNKEGINASRISKLLGISRARLSKIVTKLEKEQLIIDVQDEKDLRQNKLYLTEKGKETADDLSQKIDKEFYELIDYLGEDNMRSFIDQLQKINNFIERKSIC